MGDCQKCDLRVDFDRTVRLTFVGSNVTSDAGVVAYRQHDAVLGLTATTGKRLGLPHRPQQPSCPDVTHSTIDFSRLAGYEDVNEAERLCVDQAYGTSWVAAPIRLRLGLRPRERRPPAGTSKVRAGSGR